MMTELPVGPVVETAPCLPPARETLEGRFVSLVAVDPPRQAGPLYAASHGTPDVESIWTYMPYGPFATQDEMRTWLQERAASADPLFFAVVTRDHGEAVGMVSYLNVDVVMRHLELGHIWYAPAVQRTKANTEAAYLMLRQAFEALGHRRVEWKCDALNARSRAAALRLGFSFEGIFRHHMIVKGRNRDTAWYSMLDHEWPSRKANLERWLAAEPGTLSLTALSATVA